MLPYKKCVTEKSTIQRVQPSILHLLTVVLSIPFDNLPSYLHNEPWLIIARVQVSTFAQGNSFETMLYLSFYNSTPVKSIVLMSSDQEKIVKYGFI